MYGSVVAAMEAALVAEAVEFEGSTDTDEGTDTEVSASEAAAGSFEEESGAETVVVTDGPGWCWTGWNSIEVGSRGRCSDKPSRTVNESDGPSTEECWDAAAVFDPLSGYRTNPCATAVASACWTAIGAGTGDEAGADSVRDALAGISVWHDAANTGTADIGKGWVSFNEDKSSAWADEAQAVGALTELVAGSGIVAECVSIVVSVGNSSVLSVPTMEDSAFTNERVALMGASSTKATDAFVSGSNEDDDADTGKSSSAWFTGWGVFALADCDRVSEWAWIWDCLGVDGTVDDALFWFPCIAFRDDAVDHGGIGPTGAHGPIHG
jgi:hypothetical protein